MFRERRKGSVLPPMFKFQMTKSIMFRGRHCKGEGGAFNSNDTANHIEESFSLAVPREG